jgi:hypothetical protein
MQHFFLSKNIREISRFKKIFFFLIKRQIYRKIIKTILFRCIPDNSFCFIIDHKHEEHKKIKEFMNQKQMNFCLFNAEKGTFFEFCPKLFSYCIKSKFQKKYRKQKDFLDSYLCFLDGFTNLINLDKLSILIFLTSDNFVGNQLSFHLILEKICANVLFSKKIFLRFIFSLKKSFLKQQNFFKKQKFFFSFFLQNFFILFFKQF